MNNVFSILRIKLPHKIIGLTIGVALTGISLIAKRALSKRKKDKKCHDCCSGKGKHRHTKNKHHCCCHDTKKHDCCNHGHHNCKKAHSLKKSCNVNMRTRQWDDALKYQHRGRIGEVSHQ